MTRFFCLLIFMITTIASADASPSSDAERLINNSNFVRNGSPCKVLLDKGAHRAAVTTYATHSSSDQDCKVTSLLIAKELSTKFPSLQQCSVSFFDKEIRTSCRTITISKSEIKLIDSGKKVKDILAKVPVSHLDYAAQTAGNSAAGAASPGARHADAATGNSWTSQPLYDAISTQRKTLYSQNVVRLSASASDWTATAVPVSKGQMIWIDIKDDTGAVSRMAEDVSKNILPNQPTGAVIAKIGDDAGIFVVEKSATPLYSPSDGQIFLRINRSASQDVSVNFVKSVRILVSN